MDFCRGESVMGKGVGVCGENQHTSGIHSRYWT